MLAGGDRRINVLGVGISVLNLNSAVEVIRRKIATFGKGYICVTGVHGVIESQKDPELRAIHNRSFLTTPDGMPMVWLGQLRGHRKMNRVYGPDLMAKVCDELRDTGCRHFIFGGVPGVAEQMRKSLQERFPGIQVVGINTPPFRALNPEETEALQKQVLEAKPDIIWVGLSTPKQERFMAQFLPLLETKLMIGVGAAFDFFTGRARQAPVWVQRSGFEWLFRLACEPRRLWKRYLLNNPLFLVFLTLQGLGLCKYEEILKMEVREEPGAPATRTPPAQDVMQAVIVSRNHPPKPVRIAFIGSRGVPARYSGFEALVEELGARLAARGCNITVYNRDPYYKTRSRGWKGMKIVWLPTISTKNLDTIVHSFLSLLHALFCRYDWIYLCGVGNAPLCKLMKKISATKLIINVDGADYRRAKWGGFARHWLQKSEHAAVEVADILIADNREIVKRYSKNYQCVPRYISYGAVTDRACVNCGELARWGLVSSGYILHVSRLTPENEAHLVVEAHARLKSPLPLVITGAAGYEKAYYQQLRKQAGERVVFTGARFGEPYAELSQNALFFVMPAVIEATRLVLLDQMGFGTAILYRDIQATREVLGDTGVPFGEGVESRGVLVDALAHKIQELSSKPEYCREVGANSRERARRCYNWDKVTDEYEAILRNETARERA